MKNRITIDELRRLQGQGTPRSSAKRKVDPGVRRLSAQLEFVRELLEDDHCLRLEHRFHPPRRWRFDVALLDVMVAVEIEGGMYVPGGGAHQRQERFKADMEKYNTAAEDGWTLLRVLWEHVIDGTALALVRRVARERSKE